MPGLALALGVFFGLAGCYLPQPFQPAEKKPAQAGAPIPVSGGLLPLDAPGVAIRPIAGTPAAAAENLASAMAEALRAEEIPAYAGPGTSTSMILIGNATSRPLGPRLEAVILDWALHAPDGRRLGSSVAESIVSLGDWRAGAPPAMQTLAERSAPLLAHLLLADDGKRAEDSVPPAVALVVWTVDGLPPGPGRLLQDQMIKALRQRGFIALGPAAAPDEDRAAIILLCTVTLEPPQDRQRPIALVWTVIEEDGTELGTLRQARTVPTTAVTVDWPITARGIAGAATQGLVELLIRTGVLR